jgi:hypothetical protein
MGTIALLTINKFEVVNRGKFYLDRGQIWTPHGELTSLKKFLEMPLKAPNVVVRVGFKNTSSTPEQMFVWVWGPVNVYTCTVLDYTY